LPSFIFVGVVTVRKETKSRGLSGNRKAEPGADGKPDDAVLQSLIDFLRYPHLKTCHRCHGRGVTYANSACETCKGTGKEAIAIL
jgi:DnaJ-class molecular chaperone